MADPELYTVEEAAELLRTTPKAIYASLGRGQLPGLVRLGRRVLFKRDALRAHVGLLPSSKSCGPPERR